ncbi:MAG: cytochrome c biogenesis protein ResB [Coriobacteriia bacterium]|nr:cytochrome c biogenesis protein ResB [Coriobacteriia bacterium]
MKVRRIAPILRSRKLAAVLIALVIVYASVASLTVREDFGRAYSTPLFVAICSTLAVATALCAWERSTLALRLWRRGVGVAPGFAEKLSQRPQISVRLDQDTEGDVALAGVHAGLCALRLRVHVGEGRVAGASLWPAHLGSPLFHWSLVLLILCIGLGQLTRASGMMGVPVGSGLPDAASSYGTLKVGALHGSDLSGLTISVPEIDFGHEVGGVDRGVVPTVELYDGDELVASGAVFPNNALRYRSMMVHYSAYGLAARFSFTDGSGTKVRTFDVLYDFPEEQVPETAASVVDITIDSAPIKMTSKIPLGASDGQVLEALPAGPRVEWTLEEGSARSTGSVGVGETVDLGPRGFLALEDIVYYARLSVVDDPSVPFIYLLFSTALAGLALAVLAPPRTAWVMLVEHDDALWLHARTRQGRGDERFPRSVAEVLRTAAGPADKLA